MTDDDKAMVERLEEWEWTLRAVYKAGDLGTDEPAIVMGEASNRIEALSAENERLREALGWFLNDSRFVVQVGGNPYVVPQMIEAARAALGEKQ